MSATRRAPGLGPVRTAAVVAPSPVPMRLGGAERHWEMLRRSLEDIGIAADIVKLPVREHTLGDLLDGYEAFGLLDLSHVDLVITGKYPAWMVEHPNHVVWMLHPLRGLHDTYNPAAHEAETLPDTPAATELAAVLADPPPGLRPFDVIDLARQVDTSSAVPSRLSAAVIRLIDRLALSPTRVRRHLAISDVVAGRPTYFPPGVDVEVLVPPSCLPDPPRTEPGKGFLAVGRLDDPKRIELAIDAFRLVADPTATLTICGDGPARAGLEQRAAGDERVTFRGRVSDSELARAYADCAAVLLTPLEEDFGYVAIETMQAGRALLTTTDSGGPASLATDGVDALVVDPDPQSIAAAMRDLLERPDHARLLGERARETAAEHSWPAAAHSLVEPPAAPEVAAGRRGRVVAVSTYPIAEWPGGGPQRARHLLGALADDGWEVDVVALAPAGTGGRHLVSDGLSELTIEPSRRHARAEQRLRRLTANLAVTDIAASVLWPATPELAGAMGRALRGADMAIAVQPYLAPAVVEIAPEVPLVLDGHNHERTLKAQMLPDDEAGHWMLDRVAEAEGVAATSAALVVSTTAEDARAIEMDHGLAPGTVAVVPNGVSVQDVAFTPPQQRPLAAAELHAELSLPPGSRTALFVGSAHRPNVDAAAEILEFSRLCPEVTFLLAGEHSDQLDGRSRPRNVRLLGAVDDATLAMLLAGTDLALNPMRTGGGSNLKVLGFFAAGAPVVSTPMGVRGIPEPERYATVATVDRFADAVRRGAAESPPSDSGGRVVAARQLVEREFDWPVVARRFCELVAGVPRPAPREGTDD